MLVTHRQTTRIPMAAVHSKTKEPTFKAIHLDVPKEILSDLKKQLRVLQKGRTIVSPTAAHFVDNLAYSYLWPFQQRIQLAGVQKGLKGFQKGLADSDLEGNWRLTVSDLYDPRRYTEITKKDKIRIQMRIDRDPGNPYSEDKFYHDIEIPFTRQKPWNKDPKGKIQRFLARLRKPDEVMRITKPWHSGYKAAKDLEHSIINPPPPMDPNNPDWTIDLPAYISVHSKRYLNKLASNAKTKISSWRGA